jgi:hypothetical protein
LRSLRLLFTSLLPVQSGRTQLAAEARPER